MDDIVSPIREQIVTYGVGENCRLNGVGPDFGNPKLFPQWDLRQFLRKFLVLVAFYSPELAIVGAVEGLTSLARRY